jgi:hydroxyacylglutathione hydrolase
MEIARFYMPGLAQVAYGVADPAERVAALIDPRRDIGEYLAWAADHDYRIVAILETHVHADFVSGARELAAATGAPVYAGRLGDTEFPHRPLNDGDRIPVGHLTFQAFWTPGHTPEHMAYLLFDPSAGDEPVALFSGDVLFAGEIGRPDLLGEEKLDGLVEHLYETVTNRLARLPNNVVVYPGHGAGSPCGKKIGDAAQTTIGQEKRFNYAFQLRSKDDFVRSVMAGMPHPPAYYPIMKRVNKQGPALLEDLPTGAPLSADDVARELESGSLVIDTRDPAEFAASHIPGSVNVGLGSSFAIWAGWLAPYDRGVVLVLPGDGHYANVRTELRRVGIDKVEGYLEGGMAAWTEAGHPIDSLPEMSVAELAVSMDTPKNAPRVMDVRDETEWAAGHIPGAVNLPAGLLAQGVEAPLDPDSPVALICGTGYRSAVAASLLKQRGMRNVIAIPGGMSAWTEAGLPTA